LDFRFTTVLAGTSVIEENGALEGDLILIGGGDPTLTEEDLANMASAAVAAGLKSVTGRLLVDTSVFPEHPANDFWNWGDIGNAYGAGAYGLNVDHNTLNISFEPGAEVGAPAQVQKAGPAPRDVQWINHVMTGNEGSGDQVVVYSEPFGRRITLRGTVPKGESGFTVRGAIPDPPALAVEILRASLEAEGVKFAGESGPFPAGRQTPIAKHESAALPEIINHLHRVSDNLETQCLFLTMGQREKTRPQDVIRGFWQRTGGVDFAGFRMLDGSGLARANTIRPLDLAGVSSLGSLRPMSVKSLPLTLNETIFTVGLPAYICDLLKANTRTP